VKVPTTSWRFPLTGDAETRHQERKDGNTLTQKVVFPEARDGSISLTGGTLKFSDIEIPSGMFAQDFHLDIKVVTTGSSGAGTSYTAALIKEVLVKNEQGKTVIHAHGNAGIGVLAIFAAALKAKREGTVAERVVNDDVVAADGTYYGNWKIDHGFLGSKFSVLINFNPVSVLDYATTDPTGLTISAGIAIGVGPKKPAPGLLRGYKLDDTVKHSDEVIAALIAVDNSELSTKFTGLKFAGETLNAEQIKMIENATNYWVRGSAADGSQDPVPGVLAPDSTNPLYAALFEAGDVGTLAITTSTISLLIGKLDPYSEED
jgi:hypothetical protein